MGFLTVHWAERGARDSRRRALQALEILWAAVSWGMQLPGQC